MRPGPDGERPAHGGAPAAGGALAQQLAQAQRRLADLEAAHERFLRRVVHDLRAPLRHATSYAQLASELLRELAEPPEQVREALDCLDTLERSARRMAQMLEGLRALNEIARAPLQLQPVELHAAVRAARAELELLEAGREVAWSLPQDGGPALQADPAQLRQLLAQLLGNALKFTRARPQARIAVRATEEAPGRLRITLQDNGVGFDAARAGEVFGMFERLHRESEFEGVGAGLALCEAIAARHGAGLRITAEPDAGCTVTLDWPLALPAETH